MRFLPRDLTQSVIDLPPGRDDRQVGRNRPEDLARTYAPDKRPVKFILHHLSDSETVLFDRIRRVLSEPRQVIWVYDQDAWARGLDYARLPLEISRRVYESIREAIIYYAARYYEEQGHLEFVPASPGYER